LRGSSRIVDEVVRERHAEDEALAQPRNVLVGKLRAPGAKDTDEKGER
jgi:hypothetical protein